jgi:hypothetical protein
VSSWGKGADLEGDPGLRRVGPMRTLAPGSIEIHRPSVEAVRRQTLEDWESRPFGGRRRVALRELAHLNAGLRRSP